jgi:hypothetical protein
MIQPNTHGGARRHAGRPRKPGWKLVGVRLEAETRKLLKTVAGARETSQSALANEILKHYLHEDGNGNSWNDPTWRDGV